MPENKNPYQDRGVCFDQQEYELIEAMLLSAIDAADKHGRNDISAKARSLIPRLKQAVHAGDGLSDEASVKFQKILNDSFQSGDLVRFTSALQSLFESSIRLEADPAGRCAELMISTVVQLVDSQSIAVAVDPLLGPVTAQLDDCLRRVNEEGWAPSLPDLLSFLKDWIEYGKSNAAQGLQPWPTEDPPQDIET